jgi:hypothetical protein
MHGYKDVRGLMHSRCRIVFLLALFCVVANVAVGCIQFADPTRVKVYFSPDGGATNAVVQEINAAQQHILVQAYGFTSAPIAQALVEARKRGVEVKVVLDKSNETAKYTGATFLQNAGIPVLIDAKHAIAHNKVMVIDGKTVITGSFNFTKAAEGKNAENLLILQENPELVRLYTQNFLAHAKHSTRYQWNGASAAKNTRGRGEEQASRETALRARSSDKEGVRVIQGNLKSKVYRLPGCPGYGQGKAKNLRTFRDEREAQRAGYRRAENCQ